MKILVIGGGGREDALCWKLAQSPTVSQIFCAPGNPGTASRAKTENVALAVDDLVGLLNFAVQNSIDLTVVGPEIPLVLGIVDQFEGAGLKIFGPSAAAAQVEGSKWFSKSIMQRYGIPTAAAARFEQPEPAIAYLMKRPLPIVVKADGLAAGKGVAVCHSHLEAEAFIRSVMSERVFGEAGANVVIEDFLSGQEASILAITDGTTVLPLLAAQDHKQVGEGDTGPNTGGMGAYCPTPVVTPAVDAFVLEKILRPMVAALRSEGIVYKGILYAGVMVQDGVASVVEFNARFGDPETQCILPLLDNDLVDLMVAVVDGTLFDQKLSWKSGYCLNVVMAAKGYPGVYEKGSEIFGLDLGPQGGAQNVVPLRFHGGTSDHSGKIVTSGGRVLNVVGFGNTLSDAIAAAYADVDQISFDGAHYRRDIGRRVLHLA